jgi:UDP-3-O-[3-hydroxymyristoyl] glucosamine N-acyltransferase
VKGDVTPIPVADLVAALSGCAPAARIEGQPQQRVSGLATLVSAQSHHLAFLANPKYRSQLAATRAGAVIVSDRLASELEGASFTRIVTAQPYLYYAKAAQWFEAQMRPRGHGVVHPSAIVDPAARLEDGVEVGPHAVIEADAVIGGGARIGAGCYVGRHSRVGAESLLYPHATLYHGVRLGARCIVHSGAVLGADGFGFAPNAGRWEKIPQLGGVHIGDEVEIGAHTAIDRGALDDTVIEDGVKLDNQIQIGHNVRVGAYTAIAGCVGIAGSTIIGKRCTLGGASIIVGHLVLADDVHISAATVVMRSINEPGQYTGVFPMDTHKAWEKNAAVIRQLAELRRRLRALELGK